MLQSVSCIQTGQDRIGHQKEHQILGLNLLILSMSLTVSPKDDPVRVNKICNANKYFSIFADDRDFTEAKMDVTQRAF